MAVMVPDLRVAFQQLSYMLEQTLCLKVPKTTLVLAHAYFIENSTFQEKQF